MSSSAIITAAGTGSRMKSKIKKEYLYVNGKSILQHTVEAFCNTDVFSNICITIPPNTKEKASTMLSSSIKKCEENHINIYFVDGGETRQESVFFGLVSLKNVEPDFVLIHDGARPWITPELITRVLQDTRKYGSSLPIIPTRDTIKITDATGFIMQHLQRNSVSAAQTPQGFVYKNILHGHYEARKQSKPYTDDSEIYHDFIGPVHTVKGDPNNHKITYLKDLGPYT